MQRSKHVAWQILDRDAVLVDLSNGLSLGLNPTAAFIWSRIGDQPIEQIGLDLADAYSINRDDAARDVASFIVDLERRGLIEPDSK